MIFTEEALFFYPKQDKKIEEIANIRNCEETSEKHKDKIDIINILNRIGIRDRTTCECGQECDAYKDTNCPTCGRELNGR